MPRKTVSMAFHKDHTFCPRMFFSFRSAGAATPSFSREKMLQTIHPFLGTHKNILFEKPNQFLKKEVLLFVSGAAPRKKWLLLQQNLV